MLKSEKVFDESIVEKEFKAIEEIMQQVEELTHPETKVEEEKLENEEKISEIETTLPVAEVLEEEATLSTNCCPKA